MTFAFSNAACQLALSGVLFLPPEAGNREVASGGRADKTESSSADATASAFAQRRERDFSDLRGRKDDVVRKTLVRRRFGAHVCCCCCCCCYHGDDAHCHCSKVNVSLVETKHALVGALCYIVPRRQKLLHVQYVVSFSATRNQLTRFPSSILHFTGGVPLQMSTPVGCSLEKKMPYSSCMSECVSTFPCNVLSMLTTATSSISTGFITPCAGSRDVRARDHAALV